MVEASGVVKCDTLLATNVVASSVASGEGNLEEERRSQDDPG
jgi:hypothetical protein